LKTIFRRWTVILGRKNTTLTLAIALLFALAIFGGCATKPKPTETTEPMAETSPAPAPVETYTPPAPEEPMTPTETPTMMTETPMAFNVSDLVDVFFDYDKSDLSADSRDTLANDAKLLKAASGVNIVVEGHCDERGTNEYNLGLGERRANSVKNYLVSLGISASRIKTISYGEEKAFSSGHNEGAWKQNRRAHFGLQ
jgi:peptidoglycan-associated lipoprotein